MQEIFFKHVDIILFKLKDLDILTKFGFKLCLVCIINNYIYL